MMHFDGNHTMYMGFGFLFQLIIIGLVIFIIYWVVNSKNKISDKPETILKKRLAKGEINKKEYNSLLKEIKD